MADEDLKDRRVMHISIPIEATEEEATDFDIIVTDFVLDSFVWGNWEPFIYSHPEACEDSDHCYGPGSVPDKERTSLRAELREAVSMKNAAFQQLAEVIALVDEWEASYGITPLPAHWGITDRINQFRKILNPKEDS